MIDVLHVEFSPGDEAKESMKQRGLTFRQVAEAPILAVIPNPKYPDQLLLIVEIAGYTYAAPCELRGDRWRIITAYPSRKYHKIYAKS